MIKLKTEVPPDVVLAISKIKHDATRDHYEKCADIHAEWIDLYEIEPNWGYFRETAAREAQRKPQKKRR